MLVVHEECATEPKPREKKREPDTSTVQKGQAGVSKARGKKGLLTHHHIQRHQLQRDADEAGRQCRKNTESPDTLTDAHVRGTGRSNQHLSMNGIPDRNTPLADGVEIQKGNDPSANGNAVKMNQLKPEQCWDLRLPQAMIPPGLTGPRNDFTTALRGGQQNIEDGNEKTGGSTAGTVICTLVSVRIYTDGIFHMTHFIGFFSRCDER